MTHDRMLACRSHLLSALVQAMGERHLSDSWIENERFAVVRAANEWGEAHGCPQRVTVDDVERIEQQAVGHADYASKLALYIAEFVVFSATPQTNPEGTQR